MGAPRPTATQATLWYTFGAARSYRGCTLVHSWNGPQLPGLHFGTLSEARPQVHRYPGCTFVHFWRSAASPGAFLTVHSSVSPRWVLAVRGLSRCSWPGTYYVLFPGRGSLVPGQEHPLDLRTANTHWLCKGPFARAGVCIVALGARGTAKVPPTYPRWPTPTLTMQIYRNVSA